VLDKLKRTYEFVNPVGLKSKEMSKASGHRGRTPQSVMTPQTGSIDAMMVSDTSHNIGLQGCCTWEDIYNIFMQWRVSRK
jgi:hypothetical protein